MDAASNENESRAAIMLISPERHKNHCALRFGFLASNNVAEYKDLVSSLHLARELWAHNLKIYSDFQLVVNQINDIYLARGERMAAYLDKANGLMKTISVSSIEVIPQSKNANVNALAKLASMKDVELLDTLSVEFLAKPNIK